ncbi:MAG: type II toxin-antitoxin system Phd/YefM family antitoxin [Rhodanobacteraceae bacterium]
MQTNILEAKNRLSQLIKAAQAGEEVVIANRGEPVVRLVPVRGKGPRNQEAGSAKAILDWLENHPLPEYARRSAKEIDDYIREARNSWD